MLALEVAYERLWLRVDGSHSHSNFEKMHQDNGIT